MHRRRILGPVAGVIAASIVAGVAMAFGPQLQDPIPAHIPPSAATVGLQQVASGLNTPVKGTFAPDNDRTLYVIDQPGKIWAINVSRDDDGGGGKTLFADLSALVTPLGCFIGYDERGLLGLAFHPNFEENGLFYTYTSETGTGTGGCNSQASETAPPNHQAVVREWHARRGEDDEHRASGVAVDPTSSREVLRVNKPQFNHNGGDIAFGRDGKLYIGLGDGGNADDQGVGHVAGGNGQFLGTLLGKILRIDVNTRSAGLGYGIPADNPFVGKAGARGEIFAYGFRNPYRFSFDRRTGALYVADVGQNDIEEIDVVTKGGNFGWPIKEGTFVFNNNGAGNGFVTGDPTPPGLNLIEPIAEYDHWLDTTRAPDKTEGIAIVGGFVYRGEAIEDRRVRNHYIFGDYARAFATPTGRLFILDDNRQVTELQVSGRTSLGIAVTGFAQDAEGEIYLLGNTTGLVGGAGFPNVKTDTGVVLKLVRP